MECTYIVYIAGNSYLAIELGFFCNHHIYSQSSNLFVVDLSIFTQ